MVDFKTFFDASKKILVISLVFNFIILGINLALSLLGYGASSLSQGAGTFGSMASLASFSIIAIIALILAAISYVGNFAIIFYGGYRAAKRGLSMVNCGLVGMTTFGVVALITGIVGLIFNLFGLGAQVAATNDMMGATLTGAIGIAATIIGVVCTIGWYIIGLAVNFLIALAAGAIGGAK